MKSQNLKRSRHQKRLRRQRHERAFIFDPHVTRCLGEADREQWEFAISICGGNVAQAAKECGLEGIPNGAKALWGRSAEEALSTYRRWRKSRNN